MALYRNRETGIVQYHPKAGIGDTLNSDEVHEDGTRLDGTKPKKPRVRLGTGKRGTARAKALQSPQGSDPKATSKPAGETNTEGAE